jgi:hypothetical protein
MKIQILWVAILSVTIIGCSKEDNTLVLSSAPLTEDASANRNGNSSRYLSWVGSGPGTVEPDCFAGKGNCLPTFEVFSKIAYEQLNVAIKNDLQVNFFVNNNYANVFGVEDDSQIQSQLEKGHLKFKIIKTSTIDYCLIIKPQHEKFDITKLVGKVTLAIPVFN